MVIEGGKGRRSTDGMLPKGSKRGHSPETTVMGGSTAGLSIEKTGSKRGTTTGFVAGKNMDENVDLENKEEIGSAGNEGSMQAELPRVKERLYVYIVYARPKSGCVCKDKENRTVRVPCDCDFAYDRRVYSSVAQMHRGLRDGVGYDCGQCQKSVLPDDLSKTIGFAKTAPSLVCSKCHDSFTTENDLDEHQQVCLGFRKVGRTFKCLQCSAALDQRKDIILHISVVHPGEGAFVHEGASTHSDCEMENVCPVCDKRCPTSKHLKAHLQTHAEYANACDVCGRQCSHPGELKQHAKSHKETNVTVDKSGSADDKRKSLTGGGMSRKVKGKTVEECVFSMKKLKGKKRALNMQTSASVELNSGPDGSMILRQRKQPKTPNIYDYEVEANKEAKHSASKKSTSDLQYQCKHCERAFASRANLHQHDQQTHFGLKPYVCLICQRRFSDHALFELHREMHTETFQCKVCQVSFNRLELLRNHYHSDHVHGAGGDKQSETTNVHRAGGVKHTKTTNVHGAGGDKQTETTKTPAPCIHPCGHCKKVFSTEHYLHTHEKISHGVTKEPFQCSKCGQTFPLRSLLRTHERSRHGPGGRKFPCKFCARVFDFESDHKIHESLHQEFDGVAPETKKYKCKYCKKGLQHKTDLKLHEALHEANGRKDFPCDQCDQVFQHRLEMKQHRRNHFRDKLPKPSKCPDCDQTFIWGRLLREHTKTHWDEKPFACMYCRTRFKTQEELTNHEVIHTKGKRHQCSECKRKFKDKAVLRDHMLIHTGEQQGLNVAHHNKKYCQQNLETFIIYIILIRRFVSEFESYDLKVFNY